LAIRSAGSSCRKCARRAGYCFEHASLMALAQHFGFDLPEAETLKVSAIPDWT
jgi:hypothetical protein